MRDCSGQTKQRASRLHRPRDRGLAAALASAGTVRRTRLAAACNDLLFHRLQPTPVTEIALEDF
jgi:hypothetical protein